jgi:CRP/FNR family transcriptional regulator, dissimilatory nitrate respiration regulator
MLNKNNTLYIKNISFFKKIDISNMQIILSHSDIKQYQKDEAVFYEGDNAEKFYFVLSGYLKLCNKTLNGTESVKKLVKPGDFFGEVSLAENESYKYAAEATSQVHLLVIDAKILRGEIIKSSALAMVILTEIIKHQESLEKQIEYLAVMNTSQRIAWFLLNHSKKENQLQRKFILKQEKSLIATFLGMKPETFSRSIKKLNKLDVVIKGSEVCINNVMLLEKYCLDEHVLEKPLLQ